MTSIEAKVDNKSTPSPSNLSKNSKVLLVNDIVRSGNTLTAAYEFLKEHFREDNIWVATLFCPSDSRCKPKFYVVLTEKKVQFDWKEEGVVASAGQNLAIKFEAFSKFKML